MSAKVYVGNLSWNTGDENLRNTFAAFGNVLDAIVMRDRETGRSRGFGFVTFANANEAQAAIEGLNDQELDGRRIKVNLANTRGDRPTYGNASGYGSGGGNSYGQPAYGSGGGQPAYGGQGFPYGQQPNHNTGYPGGYGGGGGY